MLHEDPTERQTRKEIVDKRLEKAGWHLNDHSEVIEEFEISGTAASNYRITQKKPELNPSGFSDYLLLDRAGDPLAVVEAKRTSRDPISGKQQAEDYADGIKKITGKDPLSIPIKSSIIDRDYQLEALKRVFDNLLKNRRKFLLVMATGTGKTRTAMALIDVLIRAGWAQKILFLVDREALAIQAFTDGYRQHLPSESRCYIRSGEIDSNSRLFVSTIQTMMECFHKVSPGFFDIIISDECHRSIYNKWKDVLSYFHAIQIGLTATPSDFIDRDTLKFFECEDNVPTFNYSYDSAVTDGYLVDFRPAYAAQTNFQITGIKGNELPPSIQKKLVEGGLSLDDIDFEGTDLEKKVTNIGTNESLVREFMDVCIKDDSGNFGDVLDYVGTSGTSLTT